MVFTNATAESQYKNRQCLFLIKKEDGENKVYFEKS